MPYNAAVHVPASPAGMLGTLRIVVNNGMQQTHPGVTTPELALFRAAVYYRGRRAELYEYHAIMLVRLQIARQPVIPSTGESRANQDS
jgi:hypothetical protein